MVRIKSEFPVCKCRAKKQNIPSVNEPNFIKEPNKEGILRENTQEPIFMGRQKGFEHLIH